MEAIVQSLLVKVGNFANEILSHIHNNVARGGKVNFTNLSCYSALSERTYRRQYQQDFEFAALNRALVAQASRAGTALLAVMDCSFVAKSGKATFGLDRFWNGTTSRVETGLEVSVVGIVDAESEQAYALSAEQTYAQSSLSEFSRMDQYLYHLECVRPHLPPEVEYLAVDEAYAKESFVTGAVDLKLDVISKLRCDANLQFLYTGEEATGQTAQVCRQSGLYRLEPIHICCNRTT